MGDILEHMAELGFGENEDIPNPDELTLHSIGIDIGSSTSLLMLSHLTLQRKSTQLSSRFEVVHRDVEYCSPIILTPYQDSETIDVDNLMSFMTQSLQEANIDASQIDTGAVICTGEAAKKKNAEAISRLLSARVGEFVCVTAGPNMEGVLAAHGSGAAARSQAGGTTMNVDVGGGSSKVTIIQNSIVLDTTAINVGARLIAWDSQGCLMRIEEPAQRIVKSLGISLEIGQTISKDEKDILTRALSSLLFEVISRASLSPLASALLLTDSLTYHGPVDEIIFSGGVSEYIYDRDNQDYGDLGPLLGAELRKRTPSLGIPVQQGSEGVRATVIGASQYTIQVSSSTIFLSRPEVLPLRDFQVVTPWLEKEALALKPDPEVVAQAIRRAIDSFDLLKDEHHRPFALSIHWPRETSYSSLRLLAEAITLSLGSTNEDPWVLVFDTDIACLMGTLLKQELEIKPDVVTVDEIQVRDFDFIDIGQQLQESQSVPVVVKSLVFRVPDHLDSTSGTDRNK
ncbi:ethanolamine ammonia-lyase reactivating factor EutA [Chloroflexota bacterium]